MSSPWQQGTGRAAAATQRGPAEAWLWLGFLPCPGQAFPSWACLNAGGVLRCQCSLHRLACALPAPFGC